VLGTGAGSSIIKFTQTAIGSGVATCGTKLVLQNDELANFRSHGSRAINFLKCLSFNVMLAQNACILAYSM
jgi:hypothetical protein